MFRRSAGGVVIGPNGKILVVNQKSDSWSLPKGHLDPGEDEETAAVREIYEESGVKQVKVIEKLGEYERATIGKDGYGEVPEQMKHITMFLCITDQEELAPIDPENPEAQWLEIDDVVDRLTHTKDKEFFHSIMPRVLKHLVK